MIIACESDRQSHGEGLNKNRVDGMEHGMHYDVNLLGKMMGDVNPPQKAACLPRCLMQGAVDRIVESLKNEKA